jgi:serine/threonine protein kinase
MPTFETGQIFDRYRILSWLGSGTSGESYEAEDAMLLRKVTLKLIHPQEALPDSARRQFFREMQGISGLNHPVIASVLDYGEINGRLYVARRFVSNGSLLSTEGRLWYRPPLNADDAIGYTHQIAEALHAIHLRGYVHGAVTFTNLLVLHSSGLDCQDDVAPFLLADAGLAQFARRFGQNRQPLLPVSAAPEQIGKRVTPASDQFALAVLLYTWLSGRPPYTGAPEEVERLKLTESITPLSTINARITFEQDGILLRALSVFPEDRYPSVLAFADAMLSTIADQAPVTDDLPTNIEILPTDDVSQPEIEPESEAPVRAANEVEQSLALEKEPEQSPEMEEASSQEATPIIPDTPELTTTGKGAEMPPLNGRVVISSPYTDDPLEISLTNEETTVGRAGSSDILLDYDNLTSRHHALFRREGNGYVLYDRNSANGVFVNGQKISVEEGSTLADGDHISIGNYELIFRVSPTDRYPASNETGVPDQAEQYEITHMI